MSPRPAMQNPHRGQTFLSALARPRSVAELPDQAAQTDANSLYIIWQRDLKNCSARMVIRHLDMAAMGFDDRLANG
jgi:hypothetical protein